MHEKMGFSKKYEFLQMKGVKLFIVLIALFLKIINTLPKLSYSNWKNQNKSWKMHEKKGIWKITNFLQNHQLLWWARKKENMIL